MTENKGKQFRSSQRVNLNNPRIFMPENQQALFNSKKSSIEVIYTDKIDHRYDHFVKKDDSQR